MFSNELYKLYNMFHKSGNVKIASVALSGFFKELHISGIK